MTLEEKIREIISKNWGMDDIVKEIVALKLDISTEEEINTMFPITSETTSLTFEFIKDNRSKRAGAKWAITEIINRNK